MATALPDEPMPLLIVDPSRTYRDLLFRLLVTDHPVTAVTDAAEAMDLARTESFGLAIIDAFVVPIEAPQLAQHLARASPGLVAVLAAAEDGQSEHPWRDRFDLTLAKPFELAELDEVIARGSELHHERRTAAVRAA